MSVNKVIILGNIGKDIELKRTANGKAIVSFSVGCSNKWTDKNGQKHEETEWVNCTAWEKTAEMIAQYFSKGSEIFIEGKLKTDVKDDNGTKTYYTKVIVESFSFTGGSKRDGQQNHGQHQNGFNQQYQQPQQNYQQQQPTSYQQGSGGGYQQPQQNYQHQLQQNYQQQQQQQFNAPQLPVEDDMPF